MTLEEIYLKAAELIEQDKEEFSCMAIEMVSNYIFREMEDEEEVLTSFDYLSLLDKCRAARHLEEEVLTSFDYLSLLDKCRAARHLYKNVFAPQTCDDNNKILYVKHIEEAAGMKSESLECREFRLWLLAMIAASYEDFLDE